jgi:hypothetical protein
MNTLFLRVLPVCIGAVMGMPRNRQGGWHLAGSVYRGYIEEFQLTHLHKKKIKLAERLKYWWITGNIYLQNSEKYFRSLRVLVPMRHFPMLCNIRFAFANPSVRPVFLMNSASFHSTEPP